MHQALYLHASSILIFGVLLSWAIDTATGENLRKARHLTEIVARGWELREALEALDKELYDNAPGPTRPFIPDLKNPCWRADSASTGANAEGAVHCLPYVMVMGGFQCGAGSLWSALYKHPLVAKSDVSRWHFWAEFDKTMAGYLERLDRAATTVATWPAVAAAAVQAAGSGSGVGEVGSAAWMARQQRIILDGSASTFAFYWSPNVRAHRAFVRTMVPCWEGCHKNNREGLERDTCLEGCYEPARAADRAVASRLGIPYNDIALPLLISAVYGKRPPKMIVLMRNPVDRLYSAYWRYGHYRDKYGPSAEGFATFVNEQLSALRACQARNGSVSELSCLLHFETWGLKEERLFFHADQLLRGAYSVWLEGWLRYFPRSSLLLLRSEDLFAQPLVTLNKTLTWLDLDPTAIAVHARIERLSKAGVEAAAAGRTPDPAVLMKALQAESDTKLWRSVHEALLEGDERPSRFGVNRAAARAAQQMGSAASGGSIEAPNWPPMSAEIRRQLASFYAPYNQRLVELIGDPSFIQGWN